MNIRYPIYEGVYRILTFHSYSPISVPWQKWREEIHLQPGERYGRILRQGCKTGNSQGSPKLAPPSFPLLFRLWGKRRYGQIPGKSGAKQTYPVSKRGFSAISHQPRVCVFRRNGQRNRGKVLLPHLRPGTVPLPAVQTAEHQNGKEGSAGLNQYAGWVPGRVSILHMYQKSNKKTQYEPYWMLTTVSGKAAPYPNCC